MSYVTLPSVRVACSSHRPALTLARCSVAAHCASLRVLATSALRASDVRKLTRGAPCFTGLIDGYCTHNSQWSSCCALRLAVLPPLSSAWSPLCVRKAHLRCFLLHWAHRRLLQPPAAPPLSPSLDFRFACFRHWRRRSSVPLALSLGFFDSLHAYAFSASTRNESLCSERKSFFAYIFKLARLARRGIPLANHLPMNSIPATARRVTGNFSL